MHECGFCGQSCDCDGEDTWLITPEDCQHACDELGGSPYELADEDTWELEAARNQALEEKNAHPELLEMYKAMENLKLTIKAEFEITRLSKLMWRFIEWLTRIMK